MKVVTIGGISTLIFIVLSLDWTEGARIWGKFDRFGKNRRQGHLGHYRHMGSETYYQNPEVKNRTKAM